MCIINRVHKNYLALNLQKCSSVKHELFEIKNFGNVIKYNGEKNHYMIKKKFYYEISKMYEYIVHIFEYRVSTSSFK